MNILWEDLRFGLRMLCKNYMYTAVALITLALGIGANTAIFSVVNALVFRPLPFRDLDRLVAVYNSRPQKNIPKTSVAPADFLDWKDQNKVFDEFGFYRWANLTISGSIEPEHVLGFPVSANFFKVPDVAAALGRTFLPEEDQPGHEQVVVLSHGLWLRRFGGDPALIGKTIGLNGRNHVVIGIMPADFNYPTGAELWYPLAMTDQVRNARANGSLFCLARLKPGVTLSQAQAEMDLLSDRQREQHPQTNAERAVNVVLLRKDAAGDFSPGFSFALLGAAGFVLLIACANIANLQLARAAGRRREMAIRIAVGASRGRVVRQLLTESVLLSILGGSPGLLVAFVVIKYTTTSISPNYTRSIAGWNTIRLDSQALIFTLAIAIAAGIVFGLAPAQQATKPDLTEGLKEGGKSSTSGAGHRRLRSLLVVSEISLSLVLLCGAGLMVKGFSNIVATSFQGFDPDNVLTISVTVQSSRYQQPFQVAAFYQRLIQGVGAAPGVESAAAVGNLPAVNRESISFIIEGEPPPAAGQEPEADNQVASPNYFSCLRIPLLRGRFFTDQDDLSRPQVAIISQSMARRFFPNTDPIGRRVKVGSSGSSNQWLTIVGVVGDTKSYFFDNEPRPTIYRSYLQNQFGSIYLVLRTAIDPKNVIAAAKEQIRRVEPTQPISEIKTLREAISEQISGIRWATVLMAAFGVLAMILAAVGIYGVMSYNVTQRTQEIGVRMALGAKSYDVLRLIVGEALTLILLGLVIGLPIAFVLSRALSKYLFDQAVVGTGMFISLTIILVSVAILSSYLPARRAARIDPLHALKYE